MCGVFGKVEALPLDKSAAVLRCFLILSHSPKECRAPEGDVVFPGRPRGESFTLGLQAEQEGVVTSGADQRFTEEVKLVLEKSCHRHIAGPI